MVLKDTLLIRHLPPELSNVEKEELLKYFGATAVKIISSQIKNNSIAFAKFESEAKAENALLRLHQLEIFKSRLVAVYAGLDCSLSNNADDKIKITNESPNHFKNFIQKLNSWNSALNFQQPPPPHLYYVYPKANRATINNIAHALETVPKFYTQVLHLMNRMNLPPPFSNIPDNITEDGKRLLLQNEENLKRPKTVENEQDVHEYSQTATIENISREERMETDSSESELESDQEDERGNATIIPILKPVQNKKIINRPKFIKPIASTSNVIQKKDPKEIFECVDMQTNQKKIELKVSKDIISNREEENIIIEPIRKIESKGEHGTPDDTEVKYVSEKDLAANRISSKDYDVLPVFKNYHPGVPSCKLYIKNLTKTVTEEDLKHIFGRYCEDSDNEDTEFNIKLMKEGRMKGQAFITLPDVSRAQKALQNTNGYILKGKPMVIVYAKSASNK